MNEQKLYIRVTMGEDGRTAKRELMLDGRKLIEMTHEEVIDFVMQATSSLRWERAKR